MPFKPVNERSQFLRSKIRALTHTGSRMLVEIPNRLIEGPQDITGLPMNDEG